MAALAICLSSGASFAWEGRMSGMGDPYGLVSDEADFLTLPSKITQGEGIRYYGDSRFTYHNIMDLDWNARLNGSIRFLTDTIDASAKGIWNSSGDLYDYSALVGATLPAGAGRVGIFFNYTGQRGDYSGTQTIAAGPASAPNFIKASSTYDMDSSLDNFKLRVLYGQALGDGLNLGLEMQVAYVQDGTETNSSLRSVRVDGWEIANLYSLSFNQKNGFLGELFPFMKPYDSSYWEMIFKAGLDGRFGPASVGFVARGGPIFGGDNEFDSFKSAGAVITNQDETVDTYYGRNSFKLKGDVSGFKVGGDLWVRYPFSETTSLPFTVRVDYIEKNRDGSGVGAAFADSPVLSGTARLGWGYEYSEKRLDIEAGGGVDVQVSRDLRVAGGLYYNYLENREGFFLSMDTGLHLGSGLGDLIINLDDDKFPNTVKHLVKLKIAAEQNMGTWLMRGGFSVYGGWVSEDSSSALGTPVLTLNNVLGNSSSLDGTLWGLMGSFGATLNLGGCKVEPFVQAGYQSLSVDGPGRTSLLGGSIGSARWSVERETNEALVGTGLSILF